MEWYQAVGLSECISAADIVRISVLFVIGDYDVIQIGLKWAIYM
jgi:hypothetical protein